MDSPSSPLDRRRFLSWASAAGAVVAAHGCGLTAPSRAGAAPAAGEAGAPRIRRLELLTSAPLAAMRELYHGLLGLPVVEEASERLSIEGLVLTTTR